jgi:hypothetical protein
MFLTQDQAEARLNSERNLALKFNPNKESQNDTSVRNNARAMLEPPVTNTITEKVITLSGKNRINLTRDERTNIAISARTGTQTQTELARANNLQLLTVHNIASGKTKGIDEERVKQVTNAVRDLALERLMASLGLLTDDKLTGCSAKDLSTIASNMGRVVEKIQDKAEQPDNINFIIYSPELKQERAFNVIEV